MRHNVFVREYKKRENFLSSKNKSAGVTMKHSKQQNLAFENIILEIHSQFVDSWEKTSEKLK